MNNKNLFGWIMIIFLSLIPVGLWYFQGTGYVSLSNYNDITYSLGRIFGLMGMTMFALTFVLSTRLKFVEEIFGGLDKSYIAHGILGGTALIMIMAHPILLVLKFIPDNIPVAAKYLIPGGVWSVDFGIIALAIMIFLIYLTLYSKIVYNKWKFTHEFLGLVFIFAVLHIFLIRSTIAIDDIFPGYYVYASLVSMIGLISFVYSLLVRKESKEKEYRISSIKQINNEVYEIRMVPIKEPIVYRAGQFVFLSFHNKELSKEQHPFSIASKSNDKEIKVVVKSLGDFTSRLAHLKPGNKVFVEGPYGMFNEKHSEKDCVWLAAGIGITPFMGMAEDFAHHGKNRVHLFYSVRGHEHLIGINELREVEQKNDKFKVIPWITHTNGHLGIKEITNVVGNLRDKEFYLCGPSAFKDSLVNALLEAGVSKGQIHMEEFQFK